MRRGTNKRSRTSIGVSVQHHHDEGKVGVVLEKRSVGRLWVKWNNGIEENVCVEHLIELEAVGSKTSDTNGCNNETTNISENQLDIHKHIEMDIDINNNANANDIINNPIANDIINNAIANDVINNESANDVINNESANDIINNEIANDIINNEIANDIINNESANDMINNAIANDVINNENENNVINSSLNNDEHYLLSDPSSNASYTIIDNNIYQSSIDDEGEIIHPPINNNNNNNNNNIDVSQRRNWKLIANPRTKTAVVYQYFLSYGKSDETFNAVLNQVKKSELYVCKECYNKENSNTDQRENFNVDSLNYWEVRILYGSTTNLHRHLEKVGLHKNVQTIKEKGNILLINI